MLEYTKVESRVEQSRSDRSSSRAGAYVAAAHDDGLAGAVQRLRAPPPDRASSVVLAFLVALVVLALVVLVFVLVYVLILAVRVAGRELVF